MFTKQSSMHAMILLRCFRLRGFIDLNILAGSVVSRERC